MKEIVEEQEAARQKFLREQAAQLEADNGKANRKAALRDATGGDPYYLHIYDCVKSWLKCSFYDGICLTHPTPGVRVDSCPDYTLICAQADYRAEQLARRSSDGVRTYRTYAAILAEHNPGAAVEATQRPAICVRSSSLRHTRRRRISGLAIWKLQPEQHPFEVTGCLDEDRQLGQRAAALRVYGIDSVTLLTCVSCVVLSLYDRLLHVKLDGKPSLAMMWLMVLAVFVRPALPFMSYFTSFLEYDKRVVIH